jgi:phosphoribosylamine--glycine ligase
MKILVIGSGGREHALVWKLAQSPHVTQLWCAPGNAGIARERLRSNGAPVHCEPDLKADAKERLRYFAKRNKADLTVVGPDNPLADGIVDFFENKNDEFKLGDGGLRIWGPNKRAAQFEWSKSFSQGFMERHGIPTARAGTFTDPVAAKRFVAELKGRCVVKADGLALGKGVIIPSTVKEAEQAIDAMLFQPPGDHLVISGTFNNIGKPVVIQEFLEGTEISLHALCDGKSYKLFPTSQDHKRAHNGDTGLNTGGMGTYSPTPFLSDSELEKIGKQILVPWLRGCAAEGIDFHGIIYPGIMLTKRDGPKVLEFNARFGDPETQVYLPRLECDLVKLFEASIDGRLDNIELNWSPEASVCVVMTGGDYPSASSKDKLITGLDEAAELLGLKGKVFHAGTKMLEDGQIVTNGGRILGVTAWSKDLKSAQAAAYAAVEKIHFDGAHFRRDIAAKALA